MLWDLRSWATARRPRIMQVCPVLDGMVIICDNISYFKNYNYLQKPVVVISVSQQVGTNFNHMSDCPKTASQTDLFHLSLAI